MKRKSRFFHSWVLINKLYNQYFKNHGGFNNPKFIFYVYKIIIQFKSFKYLALLAGKPQNTTFVTFNYFLHFIEDFHCLL